MKSPGRKFRIDRSINPAMAFPINVVEDNAIAAVTRRPSKLSNCPRSASPIGNWRMTMTKSTPPNAAISSCCEILLPDVGV